MRWPKKSATRAIAETAAPWNARAESCRRRISAQPIALKAPAASSRMVIAATINGTTPASGLFAKWPFSHSRLPRRSTTLSIPDCRKRMARNAETNTCSKRITPSGVCGSGIRYRSTSEIKRRFFPAKGISISAGNPACLHMKSSPRRRTGGAILCLLVGLLFGIRLGIRRRCGLWGQLLSVSQRELSGRGGSDLPWSSGRPKHFAVGELESFGMNPFTLHVGPAVGRLGECLLRRRLFLLLRRVVGGSRGRRGRGREGDGKAGERQEEKERSFHAYCFYRA